MKAVKKRYLYLILGIFLILCIFLGYKKNSDNKVLEEVNLKEENIIDSRNFAIMLGDEEGNYSESKSNMWPSSEGYIFNFTKSGCIDIKGNSVEDVLSYDASNSLVTVSTSTTVYCYLYFDIITDTEPPTNNSVVINSNATYTTSASVTLTLSSTDVSEMCISNTTSCTSWETYATSKSWTLTSGDGTKTVYVWYRDEYENTSEYVTDTIILDTTYPTITASVVSNNTTSPKISFTSNESGTYCINTSSTRTNFSSCTLTGSVTANNSITTSTLSSGTYYVHVKDTVGNIGVSSAISLTKTLCDSGTAFGTCLKNAKTSGFNSTMEGGLYRYQGHYNNVNNYVCFGTTTKSTCTGNTDAYMYRVIGVNSSGQVKLIKKEAFNNTMQWYSSDSSNKTWPNSLIYSAINGSTFLTSSTYMPSSWSSKIATISWKYGDFTNINQSASAIYNIENGWTNSVSAKIGLMYVHDYVYSYRSGGLNCSIDYDTCADSWLWFARSDSNAVYPTEYTMSRYGYNSSSGAYHAWVIDSLGGLYVNGGTGLYNGRLTAKFIVRPVFYLTSSVTYQSGTGTSTDPFIIS